MSMIPVDVIYV